MCPQTAFHLWPLTNVTNLIRETITTLKGFCVSCTTLHVFIILTSCMRMWQTCIQTNNYKHINKLTMWLLTKE